MQTGLWIDHSKAVIVSIVGRKEQMVILESNINKHFRSPTGKKDSNPNGRRNVTAGDIQDREFSGHLGVFYKKVISCLKKSEAILIFGPGESKGELVKMIKKCDLSGHIIGIETAGKMTDRQIAAKVRSFFRDQDRKAGSKTVTGHLKRNFHVSRRVTDFV